MLFSALNYNHAPITEYSLLRLLDLIGPGPAPPAKPSVQDAILIPEATAGWYSLLTFSWLNPLLSLGYVRPLEVSDLYKLQDDRSAAVIADRILTSFEARRARAQEYNARLANGEISAGWRHIWWFIRGNRVDREKAWREKHGKRSPSLLLALNDSVKWWFWSGAIMKIIGDIADVTSPLVFKVHFTLHRFSRS